MTILGIETSCDECSAAVVVDAKEVLSNVIATQIELHKPYQGVVPELASRLHTECIEQVVDAAIEKAGITRSDLYAVAFTNRPGLLVSLLVGVNFGKCFDSGSNAELWLAHSVLGISRARRHRSLRSSSPAGNAIVQAGTRT